MSEPICECGHGMPRHNNFADNSGCRALVASSLPTKGLFSCSCQCFKDTRIAALEAQLAEAKKDAERWQARTEFLIELPEGFQWYKQGHSCCIVVNVNPDEYDEHFYGADWCEAIDVAIEAAGKGENL